jgi:hypothetical protein
MISVAGLSIGELAALVAGHLRSKGIEVVLVGGACISIYTENRYSSFDLDFVATGIASRKQIKAALAELNFFENQRYFKNSETDFFVEFPSGPLAVGDEPPAEISTITFPTGILRLLSPTDSVKDRLAAYYHWKDQQSLEQAILVTRDQPVDLDEVQRWSAKEGFADLFAKIRGRLEPSINGIP